MPREMRGRSADIVSIVASHACSQLRSAGQPILLHGLATVTRPHAEQMILTDTAYNFAYGSTWRRDDQARRAKPNRIAQKEDEKRAPTVHRLKALRA
eukprot:6202798-Pleurochrysis_carterae.AAC.1